MYEYGGSGDSTILVPGFSVKRRIGVGGFATVYEAVQEDVQAPVALKVLAVDHTDERVRARFERECKTMGRLRDQRGIVAVYQSAFTSDGRPVIVMAYMPGGSLLDRLRQAGTLSVEEVTTIGVTLSRALQAAHDQGIYHRDIKPENILIDRDGQVALADFGLATVDDLLTSTRTDASLTPPHAPPERFLATEDANLPAGDIYSLASTLYQLLTGRPPFGTSSDGGLAALINRVISDPPPNIDRPDMTASLTTAILLGLSKNPDDRQVSPAAFGELLAPGMIAQNSTDPGLLPLPTDRVAIPVVIPVVDAIPTSMPTRVPDPVAEIVAAQWLADPSGRYTLRYWDGELWTGHVTRGNETLWDPLESPAASIPGSIVASATSMPTRAQTPTPAQTSTPTSMPTRVVAPVTISGQQPPTGSPPTKRKRGLIMIAIGAAVLLIGGGAFAMNGNKGSGQRRQSATEEAPSTTKNTVGGNSTTDDPLTDTTANEPTGQANPKGAAPTTSTSVPGVTAGVPTTKATTATTTGTPTTTRTATTTTRTATTTTRTATTTTRTATTTTLPPVNRRGITSYDRMAPGAPYLGNGWRSAWQSFTAQSNTITYIAATIGRGAGGAATMPIYLTTSGVDGCGSGRIAGGGAAVQNYGESGIDIGNVAVTPGATYFVCYLNPEFGSWYTYWWAGGSNVLNSDQMQVKIQGYNR